MKVTIYDIAEKAGVSIATVSKVINNTGNMRESTRQRVKEVMNELNYRPNLMASALMGKGTKTLGLLVPDISNPFFAEIAKTIEDRAHEKGMSVIMCSTDENEEKEKKYLELLQNKQVDGFIVGSSFKDKSILQDLAKKGVPLIMLTQDDPSLEVTKVSVDDFKGGYEATSFHLANGHRKIAIIAEKAHSSSLRIKGYKEALKMYGVEPFDGYIVRVHSSIKNGSDAFNAIFDQNQGNLPTAIFACNDQLAIGVIKAAKLRCIDIPGQLSLIGFDDTIVASTTVPGLTTVSQPIEEMGKKTVDILLEEIQLGKSKKDRVLYNPQLIVRGTAEKIANTIEL